MVNAVAKNIFGESLLTGKTLNVITDAASVTFANTMNQSSIPTLPLNTPTIGRRVWSAPAVSTFCPDLSYNGILYNNFLYDDDWDITSTSQPSANGPINTSTELMIKNGLFTTTEAAYADYRGYAGNAGINYSGVGRVTTPTDYRYATFCWKLQTNPTSYKTLKFTFNSINTLSSVSSGGYNILNINNTSALAKKILLFYAFQDASDPSYSGGSVPVKFNTNWITGNNGAITVNATSASYDKNSATNRYGAKFGLISPGFAADNSTTTTGSVYIPTINSLSNPTYLYLRVGIPMNNLNIQFGSVTATIT
jgi:hypothetical protein